MVKASPHSAEITGIGRQQGQNGVDGRDIEPWQGEAPGTGRLAWSRHGRPLQELETAEARSKEVTTPRGEA
jgi:hypothetical protein